MPQWGQAIWAIILAAIWFWVAEGFWNVRAYAWSFGIFISLFTLIFGFFAILGSTTFEEEFVPMLIAFLIFFYLNYPGVQKHFVEHEMSLLTPEQRAAMEQVQAANAAAARAMATAGRAGRSGRAGIDPAAASAPGSAAARAGRPRRNPSRPTIGRVTRSDRRDRSAPSGSVSSCHGRGRVGLGSSTARRARSKAAVTGRPSSTGSQSMSGSERNQVRWRLAKATLRRTSSSIAAAR